MIATLQTGGFFGEMALLDQAPRNATVRAIDYCDLFLLGRDKFVRTLKCYPDFADHVREIAAARKIRSAPNPISGQTFRPNMDSGLLRPARPDEGQKLQWTGSAPIRLKAYPNDNQPPELVGLTPGVMKPSAGCDGPTRSVVPTTARRRSRRGSRYHLIDSIEIPL